MKRIQVLMSTYNATPFLKKQIDSILKQRGCKVDILIRDDGSSDNTVSILSEYSNKFNNVRLVVGKKNLGPALSFMNLVMQSGDYDYFAFADQDDVWDEDKLVIAIEKIEKYSVPSMYCTNARLIDGNDGMLGGVVYKKVNKAVEFYTISTVGNLLGCGMVFNKALRDNVIKAGTPHNLIMHDSYLSTVCVSLEGKIVYDPDPHFSYRIHGNNSIGVATNRKSAAIRFLRSVKTKRKESVAEQAAEILEIYPQICENYRRYLNKVANYNKNQFTRIAISCEPRIRFDSFHSSVVTRLAFLFGNQ